MTIQDRNRLLADLCARLPYGVMAEFRDSETNEITICQIVKIHCPSSDNPTIIGLYKNGTERIHLVSPIHCVRPYLFPLKSLHRKDEPELEFYSGITRQFDMFFPDNETTLQNTMKGVRWLYNYHYDIEDFIPKGLALDATGLNIY